MYTLPLDSPSATLENSGGKGMNLTRLHTGQRIRLDGSTGTIIILDSAPTPAPSPRY
jgi:hypothetical protein